ncbi:serine/arginine repetitive matrix protein 2 isoform X2 [Megalobrama amblycephala]|uniref:serine/arginine repetitive matrix protein 2 isoform X2 n=1 Tax=Megalobrama amblycephala TaxID=75352 RepID=UPI0020145D87|nr:serine/arginine repetitive matrix protein 2 isoform X2 [Megalobrama amblycephala]
MDVHMHNSRTHHYGLNNGANRFSEDDLEFLSLEERECILFFEETIGSLEEDDERTGMSAGGHRLAVERPASHTQTARHHSPVDHDIIDLVHPTPDPNRLKDTPPIITSPIITPPIITPDFQELIAAPETHYEVKAKHEPPAMLHVSHTPPEEFGRHPPTSSVPATATSANKIAERESVTPPSQLLQRRCSLELPQNPSVKHGPPIHAKPTRLPDSISFLLGSREHIPHSIATEAVSVQERRAKMLSNLSGSAHPLDGGEPSCVRNLPMRSISFRDPTPDKSRMEALSKLGLAQKRCQSVMRASSDAESAKTTIFKSNLPAKASADVRATDTTDHCQTRRSQPVMHTSPKDVGNVKNTTFKSALPANASADIRATDTTDHCQTRRSQPVTHASPRDAEITKTTTFKSTLPAKASADVRTTDTTDHYQAKSSPAPILTSAEITHSDFNSYGGKSITLNPTLSFRAEYVPASLPKTEASDAHLNNYGGRSRSMTTPEPTYGARSKNFPDNSSSNRTANQDLPKRKAPHSEALASRSNAQPPTPAPRPLRHPSPLSPTEPRSLEIRRKSQPKPSFRTQGITVQFSGKGATDEARRDALRKLGLLRDTS